jgi:hypothetical protein
MTPEDYKRYIQAKDRARKHKQRNGKGTGGGAKEGGAGKGLAPFSKSRDEYTGEELSRLCKLFTPVFENWYISSTLICTDSN